MDYQDQNQMGNTQNMPAAQGQSVAEAAYGPRKVNFLALILKVFAGFAGGLAGTLILLMIFLFSSSILQPVLQPVEEAANEISPLFIFVLMAMIFATSMIASIISSLLIAYTERNRYNRITTALSQIFILNIVIFVFLLPIYLTTSTARLELTAYTAGLQVILSATASALVLELIHDTRYVLLAVYSTVLSVLVASAASMILYATFGAVILLFAALPIIWTLIGFFQGALSMFYFWLYENYGIDFLATATSYGADYGIPDQSEEDEQPKQEDTEGGNFLKQ